MAWRVGSVWRERSLSALAAACLLSACTQLQAGSTPRDIPRPVEADTFGSLSSDHVACDPCASSSQCDVGSVCAAIGKPAGSEGLFCAQLCSASVPCAVGWYCDSASSAEGTATSVCLPDGDHCACSSRARAMNWTTPCFQVAYDSLGAPVGTCSGTWACTATGAACDAATPAAETCNGTDDNCDGEVDEGESLCDDGDPCTKQACAKGKCVQSGNTCGCQSDAECPVENPCLGQRKCDASLTIPACVTVPGSAIQCDTAQDTACVKHVCEAGTGQCVLDKTSDGTPCDDGKACSKSDACKDGKCQGGAALGCDDGNPCTTDACNDAKGCTHVAAAGACDLDGNACTADQCQQGQCVAGPEPVCDDGNPCTQDACTKATGACSNEPKPLDGTTCNDGNACSGPDVCSAGGCIGNAISCVDDNPCAIGTCEAQAGCGSVPNTAPCSDGDACTTGDICQGGACLGGKNSCECKVDADCANQGGGNACLGQRACTQNQCVVVAGTAVQCPPSSKPCATNACIPASGLCILMPLPDGHACDDGSACTSADACMQGSCLGKTVGCDDGKLCTTDSCAAKTGCSHVANALACDADDNLCTQGDTCAGGVCKAGPMKSCDDGNACTADSCSAKTAACSHDAAALTGKACTGPQSACGPNSCLNGTCALHNDAPCSDNNPCTTDVCDAKVGCKHTANTLVCNDSDPCTTGDACKAGTCIGAAASCDDDNVCTADSCSKTSGCVHVAGGSTCNDGDACTVGDECLAGVCKGAAKNCGDGNPCTADICTAGVCSVDWAVMDGKGCPTPAGCVGPATCKSAKCATPPGTCSGQEDWPPVVPAKFGPAQQLYDPVGFHVVKITLSSSKWQQYLAEVAMAGPDTWYGAEVNIDGVAYPGVAIRKFGYGSMVDNPQKPNVRIGFDHISSKLYGPEGVKNLRLKASGQDRTFLRQPLAQVMMQQLGAHAPRFSFARVLVNGVNYGLYQLIEQVDKHMLKQVFGNANGDRYDVVGPCIGLNCQSSSCSSVKYAYSGDPGTGTDLATLAKAAHDGSSATWVGEAAAVANLDTLVAYYAVESALSDVDGLASSGQNFTVYRDSATGLLEFIPTGQDLTFGNFSAWYDLLAPWGPPTSWCANHTDEFYARIVKTPALKAKLTGYWQQLHCGPMATATLVPIIDSYKALLKQDLYYDPKGQATQAEIDGDFSSVKNYVKKRNTAIADLLGSCP